MKNLPLIFFILFAGNSIASSLPNCPPDTWHNCFGNFTINGDKYIGEFKNGKRHGQGTYTFASGDKYIGEYKDGKYHEGTYTFASGEKYVGEFKEGKYHGQGTTTYADGEKYVGEFKNGKRHGQGTYTFADGTTQRGYSLNDEFIPDICKGMGLTKGTESFGQCVLKLIDKIDNG